MSYNKNISFHHLQIILSIILLLIKNPIQKAQGYPDATFFIRDHSAYRILKDIIMEEAIPDAFMIYGTSNSSSHIDYLKNQKDDSGGKLLLVTSSDFNETVEILSEFQENNGSIPYKPMLCLITVIERDKDEVSYVTGLKNHITLSLNDEIYLGFVRTYQENKSMRIQIWETYTVNDKTITREVTSLQCPHCTDHSQMKSLLASLYYDLLPKARRRFDLQQAVVTGAVPPKKDDTTEDNFFKIRPPWMQPVYNDLKLVLNFTESLKISKDQLILDDGNVADFAAFCQTISPSKTLSYSSLIPITYLSFEAFFLRPQVTTTVNVYEDHFGGYLWTSFLCTWISLMISLGLSYQIGNRRLKLFLRDRRFMKDCIWWSISSISLRPWHICPLTASLRILFLFGSMFSFLFYVIYSSLIISTIAIPKRSIRTFDDLITKGYILTVFQFSKPLQDLIKEMHKSYPVPITAGNVTGVNQITHLLDNLNSKPIANIAYMDAFFGEAVGQNFSKQFLCKTFDHVIVTNTHAAMIVPKYSPFREICNYKIIAIRESGLTRRYITQDEVQLEDGLCNASKTIRTDAISMKDISVLLFLFSSGILLSVVITLSEKFICTICAKQF